MILWWNGKLCCSAYQTPNEGEYLLMVWAYSILVGMLAYKHFLLRCTTFPNQVAKLQLSSYILHNHGQEFYRNKKKFWYQTTISILHECLDHLARARASSWQKCKTRGTPMWMNVTCPKSNFSGQNLWRGLRNKYTPIAAYNHFTNKSWHAFDTCIPAQLVTSQIIILPWIASAIVILQNRCAPKMPSHHIPVAYHSADYTAYKSCRSDDHTNWSPRRSPYWTFPRLSMVSRDQPRWCRAPLEMLKQRAGGWSPRH